MDSHAYRDLGDGLVKAFKVFVGLFILMFLSCSYFAAVSFDLAPKFWKYELEVNHQGESE